MQSTDELQSVSWTSPVSPFVRVYEWVHVAGHDDRDWVIQGRVCALSVCLLFHSHMDLSPLLKSARLPDPAATLIPHNRNALDHCSHKPLNEWASGFRRMQMTSSYHFPSLTSRLAVQTHMFWGKMWPSRERAMRGWKMQPCPKLIRKGTRTITALGLHGES